MYEQYQERKGSRKHKLIASISAEADSSTRKADKPCKHCWNRGDLAKYMSCIKISRRQHQLVRNIKQCSNGIRFKSLNHVLGDTKELDIQTYGAFEEEERRKLHEHWLQLVHRDLPAAFIDRKEMQMQVQHWRKSIEHEIAEKKKPIMNEEVGSSLLFKIVELLESYSIKKNVTEAIRLSKICAPVAELCVKCNEHMSNGSFYSALKTLDLIEKNYLQKVPIKALCQLIKRSTAREIGQLAVGQATLARKRDEELHTHRREAEEQSRSGLGNISYSLDIEEIDEDLVLKFDLTLVYWAHHIHTLLGLKDQF